MEDRRISILLQPFGYDKDAIDEFSGLCKDNEVQFEIGYKKAGEIMQSALDFIAIIECSPELLNFLVSFAASGTWEIFKFSILKIIRGTRSNKYQNSLKLKSGATELIIEKESISEELAMKALEVFQTTAIANKDISDSCTLMLENGVVFADDSLQEVEVLNELDYVNKYVVKNKCK